jgi:hypothetical protein
VGEPDQGYRPAELLEKEAWNLNGEYLGQIEAVAWGRNRVIRRIGIRLDNRRPDLTFVSMAGVRVDGARVIISGNPGRPGLRVLSDPPD